MKRSFTGVIKRRRNLTATAATSVVLPRDVDTADDKSSHSSVDENGNTVIRFFNKDGIERMRIMEEASKFHRSLQAPQRGHSNTSYAAIVAAEQAENEKNNAVTAVMIAKDIAENDRHQTKDLVQKQLHGKKTKFVIPLEPSTHQILVKMMELKKLSKDELIADLSESNNQSILLRNNVSNDVLGCISEALDLNGTARLLRTCKKTMVLFQNQVRNARKENQAKLQQLLDHVVRGKQNEAEELLEGYGLRLMQPDTQLKKDILYISRRGDSCEPYLQYSLITSKGQQFIDRMITQAELNAIAKKLNIPAITIPAVTIASGLPSYLDAIPKYFPLNEADLELLKSSILAITAERGHTIPQKNRGLLLMRGTTKSYAGDTIEDINSLELAYGEDDHVMFNMLLSFLGNMEKETKEDVLKELNERFPYFLPTGYDFTSLVTAINDYCYPEYSDAKEAVEKELEKFRKYVGPRMIKEGKYSRQIVQVFIDALEAFVKGGRGFYSWESWTDWQRRMFWCSVVCYLQRRLPACYGQAIRQGYVVHKDCKGVPPPLKRFTFDEVSNYYDHDDGCQYKQDKYSQFMQLVKYISEDHKSALQELMQQLDNRPSIWNKCVIQ